MNPTDSESPPELKFELGHVLFVDIVGYSKLLITEQSAALQKLKEIVRGTEQVRLAEADGKLLRLPTGDGGALVFRTTPEAPVLCALEISKALQDYPELPLRMGIHSGPVNEVTDLNEQANIAGAGINLAQRVMDCGDAGHILISKRVANDIDDYPQWRPYLHDLGECEVKHGVRLGIVNIYRDDIGNREVPKKFRVLQKQRRRLRWGTVATGLLLLAAVVIAFVLVSRRGPTSAPKVPEKSIAVLPFVNLSSDQENAFFAEGVQDDILTSLSRIGDLKVISRTSVMQYSAATGEQRNTRQIGVALGVAYLLEGSVRGERSHFVVNVQLIDAREDRQVWAEHYDRTLEDSLGLQGELATEIANTLHATLSPEEKARVALRPTSNADAYALYLRAFGLEHKPDTLLQDYKTAVQLYSQAISLDPNFALAHARLACTSAAIFHFHEPLEEWASKARVEAASALRLDPNLAEGHFALGLCLYWFDDSYEAALAEFGVASRLAPNDTDVAGLIAAIKRRKGQFREAIAEYERVAQLDPQNPNITRNLVYTYSALRQWKEAKRAATRWTQMAPDSLVAKIQTGYLDFFSTGKTSTLQRLLGQIPTGTDPDGIVTATRWDVAMLERNFAGAQTALDNSPRLAVDYLNGGNTPKAMLAGCTQVARGYPDRARPLLEEARVEFAAAAKESPLIADVRANLGLVCAFMGRKDEAIREGRRAVELRPIEKDAVDGAIMLCYLAVIYAQTGENDQAIALIKQLLQTPGAVDSVSYSMTINDLKYRWEWDRLRKDPRFQKLLAAPAPKAN